LNVKKFFFCIKCKLIYLCVCMYVSDDVDYYFLFLKQIIIKHKIHVKKNVLQMQSYNNFLKTKFFTKINLNNLDNCMHE